MLDTGGRPTGNITWLSAAQGAWELAAKDFTHIDGTSSLTEGAANRSAGTDWQAKTYKLAGGTGPAPSIQPRRLSKKSLGS